MLKISTFLNQQNIFPFLTESYSFSSEETTPQDQVSRASVASSKPTLSDIYERSEEGDSEKNKTTSTTGTVNISPHSIIKSFKVRIIGVFD